MHPDSPSDPQLESIVSEIRWYRRGPSRGITVTELINGVFLHLGQSERYDLVDEVVRLIPKSAQGELRQVVEAALQPGAAYVPFGIGRPRDWQAWKRQMIPACQRLAALFRARLETTQRAPGRKGARRRTGRSTGPDRPS